MYAEKQNKALKTVIVILAILLGVSLAALGALLVYRHTQSARPAAVVSNNYISPEGGQTKSSSLPLLGESQSGGNASGRNILSGSTQGGNVQSGSSFAATGNAVELVLNQSNGRVAVPFVAQNLFPGDEIAKAYTVTVSHQKKVTVHFGVTVKKGGKKLTEALCLKVELANTGKVLYNGPFAGAPAQCSTELAPAAQNTAEPLQYCLTVYLPTATGNAYQNLNLTADFNWWVENPGDLGPAPKTGDLTLLLPWLLIAAVSGATLVLLTARRKKGGQK